MNPTRLIGQKICFAGARQFARSQNQIDELLSSREDMGTLLTREDNYRAFQNSYLKVKMTLKP
jgi:hypothetical protein